MKTRAIFFFKKCSNSYWFQERVKITYIVWKDSTCWTVVGECACFAISLLFFFDTLFNYTVPSFKKKNSLQNSSFFHSPQNQLQCCTFDACLYRGKIKLFPLFFLGLQTFFVPWDVALSQNDFLIFWLFSLSFYVNSQIGIHTPKTFIHTTCPPSKKKKLFENKQTKLKLFLQSNPLFLWPFFHP